MIRRRAARLLLCSIAVPMVFGCSAATTTSTAPNHAAIGVPVDSPPPVADTVAVARVVATTSSSTTSSTVVTVPVAEVPAAPEHADGNEMQPAPTTPPTTAAPRRAASPAANTYVAPPTTAAPAPLTPAAAGVRLDPAAAADFAARTNSLRASLGLGSLSRNGQLDALAASWARELATSGKLRHSTIPDRVVAGGGWGTAGENVGMGGSVGSVHNALVNSAGHYANLAGEQYSAVGIGVAIGEDGRLWVCEVFAG